jgi:signal transduction histidine kinase
MERVKVAKQIVSDMAHHINNPLQGAILALSCLRAKNDLSPEVNELVLIAETQVNRVAGLSAELLRRVV